MKKIIIGFMCIITISVFTHINKNGKMDLLTRNAEALASGETDPFADCIESPGYCTVGTHIVVGIALP